MIPAPFDYEVAESVEHALELLGERRRGEAARRRALARAGDEAPPRAAVVLVDIGRLGTSPTSGTPATRRDRRAHPAQGGRGPPLLQEHCPIVSTTAGQVGDPQVRHRGTIGGSIAHGDPASDLPDRDPGPGAELVARGQGGERTIPATEFFTGVFQTALGPGRCWSRSACRSSRLGRLVVREDEPPGAGLGHGWRRRGRAALERRHRRSVDRAHEHGRDAGAGDVRPRRRSGRRVGRGRGGAATDGRSRRPTTPRARNSAASRARAHPARARGGRLGRGRSGAGLRSGPSAIRPAHAKRVVRRARRDQLEHRARPPRPCVRPRRGSGGAGGRTGPSPARPRS